MFDLFLDFENIEISSIERDDVEKVYEWIKFQDDIIYDNEYTYLSLKEFYERFIEYYLNECEFFSKVMIDSKISGIVKGRIELRNPNEVWITYLGLDGNIKNEEMKNQIVKEIINHFHVEYGIKKFYVSLMKKNDNSFVFWKTNGFNVIRMVNNFYDSGGKKEDMILLGKVL